uniref:Chitin-binding type-2 domain-containing protein n=1 Tax=Globodera pallida TaxID=36090 RepID=A0A183BN33_GLOPA
MAPQTPHGYSGNGRQFSEFPNILPINGNPPRVRPFDCNGKKDGIYLERDGACSNSFWGCSTGKPFAYGCPKGLFYNVINGKCDHRANVVACGGRPLNSSEEKPPSPEALASFNCSDKKDGLHALRHCASNVFFLCLEGRPAAMSACASGLMFDEGNSECAFIDQCGNKKPARSEAKTNSITPVLEHGTSAYYFEAQYTQRQFEIAKFNCSGKQNGAYEKSFCAPSFYTCTNGILREFNCSANSVYDAKSGQCTLPQICWHKSSQPVASVQHQPVASVQHQPVASVQHQPVASVQHQPVAPLSVNFNCGGKADGNYLHQSCQPTYLVCSNSALVEMNCPAKLVFDPSTAACEYPDNCNKNNAPAGGSNPSRPSAGPVSQAAAPFGNFSCSGRANGHYGQGHCLPNFVSCFNSLANPQNCQGGLVYDETAGKCEHPQKCGQISPLPPKYSQPMPFPSAAPPTAAPPRRPIITHSTFRCKGRVDGYYFKRPSSSASASRNSFATSSQPPATSTTVNNRQYRNNASVPPEAKDGRRLPPRRFNQLHYSPTIDHSLSGGFCVTFRKNDGLYPASDGCGSHFYACTAGITAKMDCPFGLFFDAVLSQCNHRENVAKCGGQRPDNTKIVPLSFVTSPAHQNNVHTAVITTLNVSAPNFTCSGRAIGYYSQGCSSTYFSCTGLNAYKFTCPAHLKYTELAGQCDYENNVPECGGTVLAPPPPPVPAPPTNQRPNNVHAQNIASPASQYQNPNKHPQHPANNPCGQLPNGTYGPKCSPYYLICLDGVPQDFLCQHDFVFHSPIGKCLPRQQILRMPFDRKN